MADRKGTIKRLDLISKTSYVSGVKVFFQHPVDAWTVGQISGNCIKIPSNI